MTLVVFGGVPVLVALGAAVGLIVFRGILGPILQGAEEELEKFGEDTAEVLLKAIRRRLGIPRRRSRR